uniref:Putative secreted peptide n=1 Tax=Anopheles braziliensis TaxID=58242 RepID=A0A2M3ZNF1_9DIPT
MIASPSKHSMFLLPGVALSCVLLMLLLLLLLQRLLHCHPTKLPPFVMQQRSCSTSDRVRTISQQQLQQQHTKRGRGLADCVAALVSGRGTEFKVE